MTVVNVVKIAGRSPRARAREGRPPKSGQNRQKPEKTDPKPEKTEPHMRIFQNRIKRTKHINHENYPTLSGGVSTKMTKMTKMAKMTKMTQHKLSFASKTVKTEKTEKSTCLQPSSNIRFYLEMYPFFQNGHFVIFGISSWKSDSKKGFFSFLAFLNKMIKNVHPEKKGSQNFCVSRKIGLFWRSQKWTGF